MAGISDDNKHNPFQCTSSDFLHPLLPPPHSPSATSRLPSPGARTHTISFYGLSSQPVTIRYFTTYPHRIGLSASASKLGPRCFLSSCRSTFGSNSRSLSPKGVYSDEHIPSRGPLLPFSTSKTLIFSVTLRDTMGATTPSPSPGPVTSHMKSPAGTKRKRTSGAKYYAVKKGYQPGVYYQWNDCLTQVTGYKGAVCELRSGNAFGKSHLLMKVSHF